MNYSRYIQIVRDAQRFGSVLPCPRCGIDRMRVNLFHNSYSRNADIFICPACGTEEALEAQGVVKFKKELKDWFIIRDLYAIIDDAPNKSGNYELMVQRKLTIEPETINHIIAIALEEGCLEHWCNKIEAADSKMKGENLCEQLTLGGSLKFYIESEIESEPEFYILTLEMLLRGIRLAINSGYLTNKFGSEWVVDNKVCASHICEATVDVIIQFALFGNTVYG